MDKNARDANNQAADMVTECRSQLIEKCQDIEKSITSAGTSTKK
jgi:hypothetical protein